MKRFRTVLWLNPISAAISLNVYHSFATAVHTLQPPAPSFPSTLNLGSKYVVGQAVDVALTCGNRPTRHGTISYSDVLRSCLRRTLGEGSGCPRTPYPCRLGRGTRDWSHGQPRLSFVTRGRAAGGLLLLVCARFPWPGGVTVSSWSCLNPNSLSYPRILDGHGSFGIGDCHFTGRRSKAFAPRRTALSPCFLRSSSISVQPCDVIGMTMPGSRRR